MFNQVCKDAHDELMRRVTSAHIIQPPNWDEPFEIMCDASEYAVRVVLGQRIRKTLHVIAYASTCWTKHNAITIQLKRNFLQWCFALEKFRSYLHGTKVIFTDHAALKYLLKKKKSKSRLIR